MSEIILKAIYAVIGLIVFWTILFFIAPDKMTKFWARLALFFKSAERTARNEAEPERRSGDERRVSITDFAKTQAQPMDVKDVIAKIKEKRNADV